MPLPLGDVARRAKRVPNTGDLPIKTTKIILPALFAAAFLLGNAGCPGRDNKRTDVKRTDVNVQMQQSQQSQPYVVPADPNQPDEKGWTPLMREANAGNVEAVKALIAAGANVNAPDESGWTPLIIAASGEPLKIEMVELLLRAGADVNAKTDDDITALIAASNEDEYGGKPRPNTAQVVKALIGAGADVNARRKSGYSALMKASAAGNTESIQALLDAGADVNAVNQGYFQKGHTALLYAVEFRRTDAVKLLLKAKADVSATDSYGYSPLQLALLRKCSLDMMQALIEAIETGLGE